MGDVERGRKAGVSCIRANLGLMYALDKRSHNGRIEFCAELRERGAHLT